MPSFPWLNSPCWLNFLVLRHVSVRMKWMIFQHFLTLGFNEPWVFSSGLSKGPWPSGGPFRSSHFQRYTHGITPNWGSFILGLPHCTWSNSHLQLRQLHLISLKGRRQNNAFSRNFHEFLKQWPPHIFFLERKLPEPPFDLLKKIWWRNS